MPKAVDDGKRYKMSCKLSFDGKTMDGEDFCDFKSELNYADLSYAQITVLEDILNKGMSKIGDQMTKLGKAAARAKGQGDAVDEYESTLE